MKRAMMIEKTELKYISSNINNIIIRGSDLDEIDNYLMDLDRKDILVTIFENSSIKYHYGKIKIPIYEHEEQLFQSFLFYYDQPYILTSIKNNELFDYRIVTAVPLNGGHEYDLIESIGGYIYYDTLPLDTEIIDKKGRVIISSSSITIGRFGFGFFPDDQQREKIFGWYQDNVQEGNYLASIFISDCLIINKEAEPKEALILGLILVPANKIINKFFKGIYGPYIPDEAVSTALFSFMSLIIIIQFISILIGIVFTFSITRIIKHFHKNSLEISKGKFPPQIGSKRRDQLGDLARAFDTMSFEIQMLLEKVKEKERLENEIKIAQMVQKTFFPKEAPEIKGVEIFGDCTPAKIVSGDFFDFCKQNDNTIDFCIGDISGKGISASLLMAASLTFLRLESAKSPLIDIEKIIDNFNKYLCRYSAKSLFCSLVYGRINTERSILEIVNAGHPSPVLFRNKEEHYLKSENIVCGIIMDQKFTKITYQLKPEDLLFVFTDGFTEIIRDDHYYNIRENITDMIKKNKDKDLVSIYNALINTVKEMNGGKPHMDDMTAVLISMLPSFNKNSPYQDRLKQ